MARLSRAGRADVTWGKQVMSATRRAFREEPLEDGSRWAPPRGHAKNNVQRAVDADRVFTTQHRKMGTGTPISGAQFGGK